MIELRHMFLAFEHPATKAVILLLILPLDYAKHINPLEDIKMISGSNGTLIIYFQSKHLCN